MSASLFPRATCALVAASVCLSIAASPAFGQTPEEVRTSAIISDTARTATLGRRIVNAWWLPLEYWVAAARELGQSEREIAEVRGLFRNYILIAFLDAELEKDGSFKPTSTLDIVRRLKVEVDGKEREVLRQVHPRLQEIMPSLAYVMQASLGPIAAGLRMLPVGGVDTEGNMIMSGVVRGRMKATYQADPTQDPVQFYWRSPVTAVVGPKFCPGSGERMEAHWLYCPWTGQRVP